MAVQIRSKKKATVVRVVPDAIKGALALRKKIAVSSVDRHIKQVKAAYAPYVIHEAIECLRGAVLNGDTRAAIDLLDRLGMSVPKGPPIQVNQSNDNRSVTVNDNDGHHHQSFESIIRKLAENEPNPAAARLIEATATVAE